MPFSRQSSRNGLVSFTSMGTSVNDKSYRSINIPVDIFSRKAQNSRIFAMPGSSEQRTENWISTRATITDCTQTRLMQANVLVETYAPPEFVVTFSYLADDRTFEGTYRANSPR